MLNFHCQLTKIGEAPVAVSLGAGISRGVVTFRMVLPSMGLGEVTEGEGETNVELASRQPNPYGIPGWP